MVSVSRSLAARPSSSSRSELQTDGNHYPVGDAGAAGRVLGRLGALLAAYHEVFGGRTLLAPFQGWTGPALGLRLSAVTYGSLRAHRLEQSGPVVAPDLVFCVTEGPLPPAAQVEVLPALGRYGSREFWALNVRGGSIASYRLTAEGVTLDHVVRGHEPLCSSSLPGLSYFAEDFFRA